MDYFIFDMDGTMFDTENFYYQTWREIAKKNNFSFDLEDKILLSGRKMDESISYMIEKFSMDSQKAVEIRKDLNDLREEKFEKIDYSL
ncbi:MAG: HAD hydrolase-like protein, partial [Anaerococcus obesiensis]